MVVVGVNRERAAVSLRVAGASWVEIAEVLDLAGPEVARTLVEAGLAAERVDEAEVAVLRAEESQRLLTLLRGVWGKAVDGEAPDHIPALRAALAVVDRRAKLLGLDAPAEVVVHNPDGSEIDRWVRAMIEQHTPELGLEQAVFDELA